MSLPFLLCALRWDGGTSAPRCSGSVSTLRNVVKYSVSEKQDGFISSRFCDHYMVCLQNARRLSAG